MISKDLRVELLDGRQLHNATRLLDPPIGAPTIGEGSGALALIDRLTAPSADHPEPTHYQAKPVIVLARGGKAVRAFHLLGGTVPTGSLPSLERDDLRTFRKANALPFVAVVDIDEMPRLWAEAQRRVDPGEDMVAQCLAMLTVFRQALTDAHITVVPRLLGAVPFPSYDLVQRAFDRLIPDGRTLVFYIADRDRIFVSLIARKRGGDLDLITAHPAVADDVPFLSIRASAPRIVKCVERRFGPVHIGAFIPLDAWHRLMHGDQSAIARALAGGHAVLDPAPSWLFGLVGAGAVSDAASRTARLAGKMLKSTGLPGRLFGAGAERLVQSVTNPLESIGLDIWDVMRWGREWSRRIRLDGP